MELRLQFRVIMTNVFFIFIYLYGFSWIEVWQRKRRQYLCYSNPNKAAVYKSFAYNCRHTQDDLRNSYCSNKNNQSLIEVLKTDIECGWSKASSQKEYVILIFVVSYLIVLFN